MAHVIDQTYGRNRDLGQITDPNLLAYYAGIGYTIDGTSTGPPTTPPNPPAVVVPGVWAPSGASDGDLLTVEHGQIVAASPTGGGGAVASVAGKTGVVTLVKADVGLGSVDNTADTAKPVSTAQAAADTGVQTAAASDATTKASAAQAAAIAAAATDATAKANAAQAAVLNPNDVGYDLILLLGQSNMAGRGTTTDSRYDITDPRVLVFGNPAQTGNAYSSAISLATENLLQHDGAVGVGPGLAFGRAYTMIAPANRKVLLVPCAHGGTALVPTTGTTWSASNVSGTSLYQAALSTAQAALVQAGTNARITAALWVQGETDGDSSTAAATYRTSLDAFIAQLRTDLALPTLPFVIGQMVPDYLSTGTRQAISDVHVDTPRRVTSTGFGYGPAGSAYNIGDGNHYNSAGQRGPVTKPQLPLGGSLFRAYQRALTNATGTAPITPSAPTVTQTTATAVTVAWTQPLGRATDYSVRYSTNGGSSWTALTRAQSIDVNAAITGLTGGATVAVQIATVNEQGTSAWSASGTATLAQTPNAVTSLAGGTALATQQPLTWTAPATDGTHSAATSYLVEKSPAGAATWTTAGTATTNAYTVTGLTPSTAYDYRVTAINVAGSSATATVTSLTTAASTSPLTTMGVSAWRAYGLRKLIDTYAGSAVQVRASGGTLTDIGFDGSGNLDTTALSTAAAGGTLTVQKIYDQSGNSRDLTQSTAAAQARIVNSGTIDTVGGKPCLVFSGAQFYTDTSNLGMYSGGALSMLLVLKAAQPGVATSLVVGESSTSSVNPRYWIYGGSANTSINDQIRNDANTVLASGVGTTVFDNAAHQFSFIDSGTQTGLWLDAAQKQALTNYTNARTGSVTTTNFAIATGYAGTATATNFLTGSLSELLLVQSALSTGTRQTGELNQKSYYGTP